jgi:hypothetical protein
MALTIGPGMTINAGVTLNGGPTSSITYTGWPNVYGQGVYLSGNNLQVNDSTNAAALWAVYSSLAPGTPISFVIGGTTYSTTIADPATGGGGMIAPYISLVAGHGAPSGSLVSSVSIG